MPEDPELIVRKLALLAAVHEQLEAAVTGIVPLVALAPTLVVTPPTVTVHDDDDDDEEDDVLLQPAPTTATAVDTTDAISRRLYVIRRIF